MNALMLSRDFGNYYKMNVFDTPAALALHDHASLLKSLNTVDLFYSNPQRFDDLSADFNELLVDFSKQRVTGETLQLLCNLAESQNLQTWINDLFSGTKLNTSENRAALHTALRSPKTEHLTVDGQDITHDVHTNLDRMETLVAKIHQQQWLGCTGAPINTVVNIGVGGSDLGPYMACKALNEFSPPESAQLSIHFVSSMDGSHLSELLCKLDPARTLFVISSKSFSTIDTLANADTAKAWLSTAPIHSNFDQELVIRRHFIGVSASPERMRDWGIPDSNHLYFWQWTGGRYSLWSSIGFPIALRIGMKGFREMLNGANQMDCHFKNTPFAQNLPVILALIGIWNINFLNISAHAILPYDGRLSHLPSYLEQLEMESNGKSTTRDGQTVDYKTCPILWGEIGTNAQHAFYQLLHQGTQSVMCDFIVCAQRYSAAESDTLHHQHQLNLANCLAQSQILALGDSVIPNADQAPTYKRYRGNQPCTTLLLEKLTPNTFGMLIALYEHKVFVQSVIWNINPFDQWGVELGKQIATGLLPALNTACARRQDTNNTLDTSTLGLINLIRHLNPNL